MELRRSVLCTEVTIFIVRRDAMNFIAYLILEETVVFLYICCEKYLEWKPYEDLFRFMTSAGSMHDGQSLDETDLKASRSQLVIAMFSTTIKT